MNRNHITGWVLITIGTILFTHTYLFRIGDSGRLVLSALVLLFVCAWLMYRSVAVVNRTAKRLWRWVRGVGR